MAVSTDVSGRQDPCPVPAKAKFTLADDAKLLTAVQRLGTSNWADIAQEVGNRNARQCRDRWRNYINPHLIPHTPWTDADDAILVSRLGELGPKWIAITQYLPTRSINDLKNRYHLLQRQNSLFRRRKSYPAPRGHPAPKHAVKHETPSGPVDPCQFMERFRQEFEWESGSVDSAWDLSGRSLQ